ncbi:dehydrogenase/reductase SDR family member 7-like [Lycorma delicatula]|uniref:dehydrogenase/reductase SDR family member 7-like n=1 Tax=Lycorma delicatula TaxID=130591 RepID=UPI003F50D6CF
MCSRRVNLDIFVNNAGRSQRAVWEDIDIEVDKQMFNLNVFSVLSLSCLAIKYFNEQESGHIVVTSSIVGVVPAPFSASYTGSKYAIHGYFNSLRNEKMGSNLEVTLLCPGPVFSNFLNEAFTAAPGEKFGQKVSPTDRRMTAERCAYLSAVAIANKLDEVWIALFPLLPLCYILVNFPFITRQ